jgi:hypothetical protein
MRAVIATEHADLLRQQIQTQDIENRAQEAKKGRVMFFQHLNFLILDPI